MLPINFVSTVCEISIRWLQRTHLVISQHWIRYWLGAVRQQSIIWTKVDPDLYHRMTSLNVLTLCTKMTVTLQTMISSALHSINISGIWLNCYWISSYAALIMIRKDIITLDMAPKQYLKTFIRRLSMHINVNCPRVKNTHALQNSMMYHVHFQLRNGIFIVIKVKSWWARWRFKITGVSTVCSTAFSCADQWKHQSFASLDFVRGMHRWPVVSLTKGQ